MRQLREERDTWVWWEKANHSAAQRWWRTLPDEISVADAQHRLDLFCATKTDARRRVVDDVGDEDDCRRDRGCERLRPLPATAFPASLDVERTIAALRDRLDESGVTVLAAEVSRRVSHKLMH